MRKKRKVSIIMKRKALMTRCNLTTLAKHSITC